MSYDEQPDGNPHGECAAEIHRLEARVVKLEGQVSLLAESKAAMYMQERDALAARLAELETRKDGAYFERNQLVSLLSKLFPSGTKRTSIDGWSADWHGCVYIDLPTGQVSWHYHDSHATLFAHLPPYAGSWDGHTTEQKYERVAKVEALEKQTPAAWIFVPNRELLWPSEVEATNPIELASYTPLYAAPVATKPDASEKTWCGYVAGMIGCYLGEPVDSDKVKAIAAIIERRLWALYG